MRVIMNIPKTKFTSKIQNDNFTLDTDSAILLKFDELLKSMKTQKHNEVNLSNDVVNDKSTDVKRLEKLFNIDIKNNPEEFINSDGTINLFDIINSYGNNLSSNDLREFGDTINALYKNNKISDDDYFYALNWINKKFLEKSVTLSIHDKIDKENLKIVDHKKDEKTLREIAKKKERSSKLVSFDTVKSHDKNHIL
ncbi:MAG: hypothetical protein GX309_01445 [Clostridiales bacterium]|nr:hypothetical protein [Clostridiales bacterium]